MKETAILVEKKETDGVSCPVCSGKDFGKIIIGFEGNPKKFLKCTQCGKEFPEVEPCNGESCKI
jgi:DNA-directed RNA polymerase subunit RPC12/RpoP